MSQPFNFEQALKGLQSGKDLTGKRRRTHAADKAIN